MSSKHVSVLILLLFISTVFSAEIFVSKQRGDDNNDGSKEHPVATIRKAYLKSKDGDTINIEPAVYSEQNTIQKSLKIKGYGGKPLISGNFYFKDNKIIELTDIAIEANTGDMISADRIESIKISNVNLGPKYMRQGHGIRIQNTKKVEISNVKVIESDVGIYISGSGFHISNVSIDKCKIGMVLWAKGTVDDSTISQTTGNYNILGAGINANGDVTLRNVNLLNNEASVYRKTGGAFYCGGGGLNIFGGKVIGNKAVYGAAGDCENTCSFFASGTEFKDNESEFPSKCRGIPSKK
eukprot:gene8987-1086_t